MAAERSIPQVGKAIVWRHDTRDYDGYLDGQYIASFKTYTLAETTLDHLALEWARAGSVWSGRSGRVDDVEVPS